MADIVMEKGLEGQKWLIIVVDGMTKLASYWSEIFTLYLQKIIRCFCAKSQEQGAMTTTCKLGLVMYNTNSELGFDVQSVDWTTNMDSFLKTLSCVDFNGNAFNQYAMAEGLAEALVMYTRPFNATSTAQDYYNGERHCVLVTIGEPLPLKMSVSVPMVHEGKLVLGKQLETNIDFLEVTQMFSKLATSFSVISPSQHAIFAELFNMGNTISEMENAPFSNYKVDEVFVMISKNFKEAHEAIYEKGVVLHDSILESLRTSDISFTELLTCDLQDSEDLFSFREQTIKRAKDVRPESQVNTNCITNASSFTKNNAHEDYDIGQPSKKYKTCINLDPLTGLILPPQLSSFGGVIDSFGEEQTNFTLKMDSYMDALKAVAALEKPMEGGGGNNNDNNAVQISPPLVFPKAPSTTSNGLMEFPKLGPLHDEPKINVGLLNSFNTGNTSTTSAFLPHQNSSILWHTSPPQQVRNVHGNSFYPNVSGNSVLGGGSSNNSNFGGGSSSNSLFRKSMSKSLSGGGSSSNSHLGGGSSSNAHLGGGSSSNSHLGGGSSSNSHLGGGSSINSHLGGGSSSNSHLGGGSSTNSLYGGGSSSISLFRRSMSKSLSGGGSSSSSRLGVGSSSNIGTRNIKMLPHVPRNIPTVTGPESSLFLPLPCTRDFENDYVQMAWEGQISGRIKVGGKIYHDEGQGFTKPTSSPFLLTFQWPNILEIIHYIPLRAVIHTQRLTQNDVDYVYFHIKQQNNRRLHDHLIKNDMCARINLPSQTLILTPTEKELYYVGTIFQGGIAFVEL